MIPHIIHQIWVGDEPAPKKWMSSWRKKNPDWEYRLWDNEAIKKLDIKNKKHFLYYWNYHIWHGVADILRYEILYTYGGYMPGADSECLRKLGDSFDDPDYNAYTCYVNEMIRPGMVAPLMACKKHNEFARLLVEGIYAKKSMCNKQVWQQVGNQFVFDTLRKSKYDKIRIFPSHYFIPEYSNGHKYRGLDKPYAFHHWGITNNNYPKKI